MKTPEFEVTCTGGTQPEVKALLVNEALSIVRFLAAWTSSKHNTKEAGDPILLLTIFLCIKN